jgi:hypothetical protein
MDGDLCTTARVFWRGVVDEYVDIELERIQTQMAQKSMLRAEV